MKPLTRSILPGIFSNPINRNLILIFLTALVGAIMLVTGVFLLSDHW